MPKPNRAYKRNEPFRDASLFIIACEGKKREVEYFETLVKGSKSLQVKVLGPVGEEEGKSAPRYVLDRAASYEEEAGLINDKDWGDKLFLVLDVDRWEYEHLREVSEHCKEREDWEVVISNPCFEVWLHLHMKSFESDEKIACQKLKTLLDGLTPGGYNIEHYLEKVKDAVSRAREIDKDPQHFYPDIMTTKVYQMVEQILKRL